MGGEVTGKVCPRCNKRRVTNRWANYCEVCRAADKHRNYTRGTVKGGTRKSEGLPQIFVSVDCEGREGYLICISYGREDGSYNSLWTYSPRSALLWLIEELAGHYTDGQGREHLQVVTAFHFNWDTAVLAKAFDPADMELVHKAGCRKAGQICRADHKPGDTCKGMLHAYNPLDIEAVITDGGEGDVIAWDRKSGLAIAATPKRRFYVEYRPYGDRYENWKVVDIHDHGTAFVGGLEHVIDVWQPEQTPREREMIAWGKRSRVDGFLDGSDDDIMEYNASECIADARCARKLIDSIREAAGIPIAPRTLFGSGTLAGNAYKFHKVATRKESQDDAVMHDLARLTYFGGIIETCVVGIIHAGMVGNGSGRVDGEDISSAYPARMQDLPCMRKNHGHWVTGKPANKIALGYAQVTWNIGMGADKYDGAAPPFVVRHPYGSVYQPLYCPDKVWVTLPEYWAAKRKFGNKIKCHAYQWWQPSCNCPNQFTWMVSLYEQRLEIKAQMKQCGRGSDQWHALNCRQEALKLVLNSCYGKLAQQRPTLGKYTNMHYASYITGGTRAAVRERTWYQESKGGTVVYQHTDSVLSVDGEPKDDGNRLGGFKVEDPSYEFVLIQPGLAMSLVKGGKTASRGCKESVFIDECTEWAGQVDFTQHPSTWPVLKLPQKRMISRRQALSWGRPEDAGTFKDQPLDVTIRHGKRRVVDVYHPDTDDVAIAGARPLPGYPGAWILPPVFRVPEIATIEDLTVYQTLIEKRIKAGEFDDTPFETD